jgi:hypothetical protein
MSSNNNNSKSRQQLLSLSLTTLINASKKSTTISSKSVSKNYREQLNLKTASIHKCSSYKNLLKNKWTKKTQYSILSSTCRIVERNKTQAQPNVQQTKMNINQPLSAQMQKKKKSAVLSERNLNELNLVHNNQEKLFTNKTKDSKLSLKPSTLKRIFVNRLISRKDCNLIY